MTDPPPGTAGPPPGTAGPPPGTAGPPPGQRPDPPPARADEPLPGLINDPGPINDPLPGLANDPLPGLAADPLPGTAAESLPGVPAPGPPAGPLPWTVGDPLPGTAADPLPGRAAERRVLRLARPYLGRLIGAGLLAAATDLAGLALMATATWLLMTAAARPPLQVLAVAIAAVRALAVGRGVLRYAERLTGHDAVLRLLTDVRARVFANLAALRTPRPGDHSGDALSRLVSDVDAVQDLLLRVIVPGAAAALVGVLAVTGAALLEPAAAVALAVGLLVAGLVLPVLAGALTRRTADRVAPLRGRYAADAVDLTAGAADLAAFGATAAALDRANRRGRELAALERRLALAGWAVDGLGVLVTGLTAAAVVLLALRSGAAGVLVGVLAVGSLVAVESVLALVGAARQLSQLGGALRRVAVLLDPPDRAARPAAGPLPATPPTAGTPTAAGTPRAVPPAAGPLPGTGLRLRGITVSYRDGTAALDGIDLDVPPGRRIAVVGPSGAGKSTLLAVITGTVRPTAGTAVLDGVDPVDYPDADLPTAAGGLLAEAYVFHTTVRENLLLGRLGAGEDELTAAAAAAGLLAWVREQPDGWDTVVGADGAQLSGGQRQRLALARALLAAPRTLLLDEPTEGLDPAAADAVLAAVLATTPPGHAVILVTHRLRGLDALDEVVVLDRGRITQRGRHAELIGRPGWYREQWTMQEAAERGYLALSR